LRLRHTITILTLRYLFEQNSSVKTKSDKRLEMLMHKDANIANRARQKYSYLEEVSTKES